LLHIVLYLHFAAFDPSFYSWLSWLFRRWLEVLSAMAHNLKRCVELRWWWFITSVAMVGLEPKGLLVWVEDRSGLRSTVALYKLRFVFLEARRVSVEVEQLGVLGCSYFGFKVERISSVHISRTGTRRDFAILLWLNHRLWRESTTEVFTSLLSGSSHRSSFLRPWWVA
jgi:hypothetical protein